MASSSLRPYPHELQPNGTTYHFVTDQRVAYEAYFTEGDGYFPNSSFGPHTQLFNIFPLADSYPPIGFDARVGLTIADIIAEKFVADPFAVVCYVCDQTAGRAYQRALRFTRIFDESEASKQLVKQEINRPPVFAAVLFHRDNPARWEIEQGVRLLAEKFD